MINEGDIVDIDKDWCKIYREGKWYKGKRVYQRIQGELEQFHDVLITNEVITN